MNRRGCLRGSNPAPPLSMHRARLSQRTELCSSLLAQADTYSTGTWLSRVMRFIPLCRHRAARSSSNWLHADTQGSFRSIIVRGEGPLQTGPVQTIGPIEDAAWFPQGNHLAFSSHGVIYDSSGMQPLASLVGGNHSEPAISPNGRWLAFTAFRAGLLHIWIENLQTKVARELTGGTCNSFAPTWELDSKGLIFSSDCGRGLGLPRLYRATVD